MLSSKVKDKGSSPFPPVFLSNTNNNMRINSNFHYDKLHLKEIIILIPKYHTNMVSFLTPILGLYGINVKEFINDFDTKTKFINFDVIIPTLVRISKIKTFEIILKTPYVVSILSNLPNFSITRPNIDLLSIYKISLLKSIFYSNFLNIFHKRIYLSLRKYLSLVIKVNFQLTVSTVSIKKPLLNQSNLVALKRTLHNIILFKKLLFNKYGVFVMFNSNSAVKINYLKTVLAIYNTSIFKVKPNILSSFIGNGYFRGNVFFIGSNKLTYSLSFLKDSTLKVFGSDFFPIYFKVGSNLVSPKFFKTFLVSFNLLIKLVNFYFLKLINLVFVRVLKVLNFLNKKLLFLLKNNANLSSNIKKS